MTSTARNGPGTHLLPSGSQSLVVRGPHICAVRPVSPLLVLDSRARLPQDATICDRVAELKQLVCNNTTQRFLELALTELDQRLMAIQDRWDRLRAAIVARAAGDHKRMKATSVVCMKLKSVRGKNNVPRVYREYEIDTGVIEALNSVERRTAIESGQEQENVNLTGQISAKSIALSKVMSLEELEALEAKMLAVMEAERQGKTIEAAPTVAGEKK